MERLFFILTFIQIGISLEPDLTLVEEVSPPVFLGNVANLTDIINTINNDEFNSLRYTLLSNSDETDQKFRIDETSGDLLSIESIDREERCSYVQDCILKLGVAVQSLTSAFFRQFTMNIRILDINDSEPEFNIDEFELNIMEDTQIGSSFQLPVATDRDGASQYESIDYHISKTSSPFDLFVRGSVPCLVLVSEIDRETTDAYTTLLIASDGMDPARSSTLTISISIKDANDNAPVFEQNTYETRIPETTLVNTTILHVLAFDIDLDANGKISYFLSKQNDASVVKYFQIAKLTGNIYVQNDLRTEEGNTFVLGVTASDSGLPLLSTSINVTVHVTDTENDIPIINTQLLFSKNGVASVQESSPFGRVVALVNVEDNDSGFNGETVCSMESSYFQLQRLQPKEYRVFVRRPLNREVVSQHDLVINCHDLGSPPLKSTSSFTVSVEDENDSIPVFEHDIYTFNVEENGTLPTYIGHVTAIDKDFGTNGEVVYEIEMVNTEYNFSINITGHIFCVSVLDYEMMSHLVFNVLAIDKGEHPLTATAAIILNITDINDNAPSFDRSVYTFRIMENEPVRFLLGCISANDNDSDENGNVTFTTLRHETVDLMPFSVSSYGCIKLGKKLDYEQKQSYEFGIIAADNGIPVLETTVYVVVSVIDENDNKPVIIFPVQNNDTIIIGHNTVPRSEIATVQAYDIDSNENGKLLFTLTSQNGSNLFDIDTSTGHISTTREIDNNDINSYNLVIRVSDFGTPKLESSTNLKVDIQELPIPELELLNRFKNLKIVSILVCVTILLSLAVMTIVCLIKYMDKRNKKVSITRTQTGNARYMRDFNEISPIPDTNNLYTVQSKRYTRHDVQYTTVVSDSTPSNCTVARQNRYNDVVMLSRDSPINQTPKQEKRPMKVYRRTKHVPHLDESNGRQKSENNIDSDFDANVLDILRRHNQVVRSVKATKPQCRQLASDVFNKDPYGWRERPQDTIGSDSGIDGSDVEIRALPVYTIPV